MKPTKNQELASTIKGHNILISAGAGSGKTAVLTKRIINLLKGGLRLPEILVVTFTNQASFEMLKRIKNMLIEEGMLDHLKDLDGAFIMTFDAFSLNIVKRFHYLLNLPADVAIIDEAILVSVKRNMLTEIMEEKYQTDEDFIELVSLFYGKDDKAFCKAILNIEKLISSRYDRINYLDNYSNNYYNEEIYEHFKEEYLTLKEAEAQNIIKLLEELNYHLVSDEQEAINHLINLLSAKGENISEFSYSLPIKRKNPEYASLRKQTKEALDKYISDFSLDCSYEGYLAMGKFSLIIVDILRLLHTKVDAWMDSMASFSFNDIAIKAIEIVQDFPVAKETLKAEFKEILIDEYQDTSLIQEQFINQIASLNVYMVGDIKQAIYRFRRANPYLFVGKYNSYYDITNNLPSSDVLGYLIDLSDNFRSRPEVIAIVNKIFSTLMTDFFGDADFLARHQMKASLPIYKTNSLYTPEILCYEESKELKNAEIEAFKIGYKIKEIVGSFPLVEGYVDYKDIAILLDRKTDFSIYREIFAYLGIPLNILADEDLKTSVIYNIIYAYLTLIITNEDDPKFAFYYTLLRRSYLNNFTDSDIYLELQGTKNSKIYDDIIYLKSYYINHSVLDVLDYIITSTKLLENLDLIGDATANIATLEHIYSLLDNLANLGYSLEATVAIFADIIDQEIEIRIPAPKNPAGVRLMTIHKAKGLEFPVCFFAGLSKPFNYTDSLDKFTYDDNLGILTPLSEEGFFYNFMKTLLQKRYNQAEISEKIRLFYVALTRPKEKMYIISPLLEEFSNIAKARSFYDFLCYVDTQDGLSTTNFTPSVDSDYKIIKKPSLHEALSEEWDYDIKEYVPHIQRQGEISKRVDKILSPKEKANIETGLLLHSYLEALNLANPDTSFIPDEYQGYINKILKLPEMAKIHLGTYYQEHEFYFTKNDKSYHGIIDLLVEYDSYIDIIDYKLVNTDKEEYIRQLSVYNDYVRTFSQKPINLYLLSLIKGEITIVKLVS